jgi:UDP-N-acetylmuramate: L-alanyl-gamma-D-glutamyl-meso-diaminopimelate ligase
MIPLALPNWGFRLSKHVHILGICGTFMGGVALLARELGFEVSGSDANVYPPMSTQLEAAGITLCEGYREEHLQSAPDLVIVGNALSRGNPAIEYLLNSRIPYVSGPQWLAENLLCERWVLAVAGTHGKTSTSSLLAWILEQADMAPGFLIGGVPGNFGLSARLGNSDFFVVEADEYDTAFFDKRSKFVHYHPRTLCLNNLEFDHADIFSDLEAIKTQFHHLMRTVPSDGLVIHRGGDEALNDVLARGCWSQTTTFGTAAGSDWTVVDATADGSKFEIVHGSERALVEWQFTGQHNIENALAAVAAAHHVGVPLAVAAEGLASFEGVKRRMELLADIAGIRVYDDFAHHPTAIATTLEGLRAQIGAGRILVLIEPRSRSMRMGQHRAALSAATASADHVYWYQPPGLDWDLQDVVQASTVPADLCSEITNMAATVVAASRTGDHIIIMSNGGFDGIHETLVGELAKFHGQNP